MMYIGIDIGSRTTKIVFWDGNRILFHKTVSTAVNPVDSAEILLENGCMFLNLDRRNPGKIVITGYGKNIASMSDMKISEITCHARGIYHLFPRVRTTIDIGGQDCKAIIHGDKGNVVDFAMNDRCAAGTGRFLEMTAMILGIPVNALGELHLKKKNEVNISNTCVVFAESEIIGLLSQGEEPANIVAAVHDSIAKRIMNLLAGLNWHPPVVLTGGVALNRGLSLSLQNLLKQELMVPPEPEITGALGAAILATGY